MSSASRINGRLSVQAAARPSPHRAGPARAPTASAWCSTCATKTAPGMLRPYLQYVESLADEIEQRRREVRPAALRQRRRRPWELPHGQHILPPPRPRLAPELPPLRPLGTTKSTFAVAMARSWVTTSATSTCSATLPATTTSMHCSCTPPRARSSSSMTWTGTCRARRGLDQSTRDQVA